ncbi:MAG TPA: thiamine pyrophosphate-dependent dehydrogenase E1 component subunit alpha [Planctomycetota bacterium]|nr:thiamine pyrophosphate-dependent dehydrogenase E1 component subunit alpha [Planctomycetota bacterium]
MSASPDDLDRLEELLRRMVLIRLTEQYVAKRYPEQAMKCPTHLCVGQEGIAAAFGVASGPADVFLGSYRSHGHYLAKGGSLRPLFAELLGRATGCSAGLGGSMHVVDEGAGFLGSSAIVGGTVPIAAGVAFGFRRRREPRVAVVFFGDAALEEGVVYETVNFAVLHALPLVLVCENNGLAINTPLGVRSASTRLHGRFASLGLAGESVPGSDPLALLHAARRALESARQGSPAFVEAPVTRFASHVGHALSGPVDAWSEAPETAAGACPIARAARDLVAAKRLSLAQLEALRGETQAVVEAAYAAALADPPAQPRSLERASLAGARLASLPRGAAAAAPGEGVDPSRLVNPF